MSHFPDESVLVKIFFTIPTYRYFAHLSVVEGLVVRHGDLSLEMTLKILIECDKSHVSLPSYNN